MLGDGIGLAEIVASPPELDKTDCLSRGADDFANDGAAHGIDDAGELGEQPVAGRLFDPPAVPGDTRPNRLGAEGSGQWAVSAAIVPSSSLPPPGA